MTPVEAVALLFAGAAAGGINTLVGSGTLITFPTLLAFGVPPVTANVSNNIGLLPGSLAGAWGYRRELVGQRTRAIRLAVASVIGGTTGAVLLLVLPSSAFDTIVPFLVLLGVVLVLAQPAISRRVAARRAERGVVGTGVPVWVWISTAAAGVYGGYFGAAQGVILMGVLGIGIVEDLQRLNAVKNVLASVVNGVAAVVFVFVAHVDWPIAGIIALGSVVGGTLAARFGRRLPAVALRGLIAVVGLVAVTALLVT
ncbi:sulfite exporter TauE/SafE family protein [Nocardioides acrostichi]|uniref:Probable membrane transporter protein n=1 Tax=Nocardioides acrostichi TaxID=2784339 RepID=A0A930V3F5_9ACTN|nr:sulfite exporter TauE/SafE family protein [Nocardioides acrostichi]MBF4163141.1 sulfite exporter TauE/SafE family protein [Nocardioides acrostichi]